MFKRRKRPPSWEMPLIHASPLREFDPRTKLALSLSTSLAVMLPLKQLAIATLCYVSLELATSVTIRISLLASTFSLFFATTTPAEFRLALESLGFPYRYAFSLSLAFQNLTEFDRETNLIREAQRSRGAWTPPDGWKKIIKFTQDLISLTVPAVVMTTKRAWTMTEAAYARGFNSPKRKPYQKLAMKNKDWILLAIAVSFGIALIIWR
ncbi:MAG: energy-coupling factor transporter transmembrane component T [Anaerolineales bacterium]